MNPKSYRLATDVQRDLEWYWCHAAGQMGLRSNTGAAIERLEAAAYTDATREECREAEKWARDPRNLPEQTMHVRAPSSVVRATSPMSEPTRVACHDYDEIDLALAMLRTGSDQGPRHYAVLRHVYGRKLEPRDRYEGEEALGTEFAPLAEMTEAVLKRLDGEHATPRLAVRKLAKSPVIAEKIRAEADRMLVAASRALAVAWKSARKRRQDDDRGGIAETFEDLERESGTMRAHLSDKRVA